MENKVLGREFKKGLKQGVQEGELTILRQQIEKRFGAIPEWAEKRLSASKAGELEAYGVRVFDATSIEDLLKPKSTPVPAARRSRAGNGRSKAT